MNLVWQIQKERGEVTISLPLKPLMG